MSDFDSRASSPTIALIEDDNDDSSEEQLHFPPELLGIFSLEDALGLLHTSDFFEQSDDGVDERPEPTHTDPNRRLIEMASTVPLSIRMDDDIDTLESVRDAESPAEAALGDIGQTQDVFSQDDFDVLTLDEPVYPNQPETWSPHHEYFLLSCCGTVQTITEHMQQIYKFWPPLQESFVRSKLVNNAGKQLMFLQRYLPGETHSMLRAESRIILRQSDLTDPNVVNGTQNIDPLVKQLDSKDPRYAKPRIPPGLASSEDWSTQHDNYLFLFLGDDPQNFLTRCAYLFNSPPTSSFVAVRMAQLPFLGLDVTELNNTKVVLEHATVQREGMFF